MLENQMGDQPIGDQPEKRVGERRQGDRRQAGRRQGDRRREDRRQIVQWPGEAPPQDLVDEACDIVFEGLLIVEQEKMRQLAILRFPLDQRAEVEELPNTEIGNNWELHARLTKYRRQAVLKHHTTAVIEVLLEQNAVEEGATDGEGL